MSDESVNNKVRKVAAFDFDGTIIKHDSLFDFIKHAVPFSRMVYGSIKAVPYFALYALKLMPNFAAKEKVFTAFFKGWRLDDFNKVCVDFIPKINAMVNPDAIKKIKWHQQMGHEVIIISASVENWIIPWATKMGINTVLATQIEVIDGRITGKFQSKNCHGPEKVNRLRTHLPDFENYELYAYGDSNGDKEMLLIADHKFYRCFV